MHDPSRNPATNSFFPSREQREGQPLDARLDQLEYAARMVQNLSVSKHDKSKVFVDLGVWKMDIIKLDSTWPATRCLNQYNIYTKIVPINV